ncbi:MAG TPA: hypothetical protein VN874_00385 [Myxococcales bacterium]|jgi:hypothetical protein|nr:hypothetical protein [Myxococcales bacterium]
MIVLIGLLAALPIELELSAGAAFNDKRNAPVMQARAGVDLFSHLTVGASLLGIPGSEDRRAFCALPSCYPTTPQTWFKAISGFVTLRAHTSGDLQVFVDGGVGVGHLISLSPSNLFEDPALYGRAGPAFLLGMGGRWFVTHNLAAGVELSWTQWTHVARPFYVYGADFVPATTTLAVHAVLLQFSLGWAFGR